MCFSLNIFIKQLYGSLKGVICLQAFLKSNKWVILLSGALIQIFTGVPAAWGVFQASVCNSYKLSEYIGSMIFSFVIFSFGIGCALGGFLQDKKGPRFAAIIGTVLLSFGFITCGFLPQQRPILMYLLFSLPTGFGTALLYPSVMACAQKWYTNKKGFATGIIGGATGLSGAVLTLLGTWLINSFGIRSAFIILGFIIAVVCGLSCIVLENPRDTCDFAPQDKNKINYAKYERIQPEPTQNNTLTSDNNGIFHIFKTREYYLLTAAVCFANPSMILFSPIIVQLAQNRGLSIGIALSCIAVGSVFSSFGRLTMPWLSDKTGRKKVLVLLFSVLFSASTLFIFANGIWVLFVYCALAFCYSGQAAVLPATVTDLYGKKNTGLHYGLVAIGMSVGSILFPLLALLFQSSEGTRHIIAICATFLGLVCVLLLKPIKRS